MKEFNSIIKGFKKTITKLDNLVAKKDKEKTLKTMKVADMEAEIISIEKEGKTAMTVSNKLKDIFGPLQED